MPLAEPFEIGPVLDVVPYVNADGYTIQLTILPTLKEFLGYDDPGAFVAQVQSVGAQGGANNQALTQPTPLPKFRLRQVATTAMVWDGQTVVLQRFVDQYINRGDIALFHLLHRRTVHELYDLPGGHGFLGKCALRHRLLL